MKSEVLVVGVVGMFFFGSYLMFFGWVGILVGVIVVFVLSSGNWFYGISVKIMVIGFVCGICFVLILLLVCEVSYMLNV